MTGDQQRIMIVDDDPAILDAMTLMLEDEGYQIEAIADATCLQQRLAQLPALVLLDIRMSGIDGRDVCRNFKSDPATQHIPVIIISANRDTARLAAEAGADDFLEKPFDIDNLIAKIERHLRS